MAMTNPSSMDVKYGKGKNLCANEIHYFFKSVLRFEKINQHSNVLQCSMQKYEKHKT